MKLFFIINGDAVYGTVLIFNIVFLNTFLGNKMFSFCILKKVYRF